MLFAQLSHAMGLNDVCDWLRLKSAALARFGVTPSSKNGLSNANKERNAEFAEKLFWSVRGHLQHASPSFAAGRKGKGLLRRFKAQDALCSAYGTAVYPECSSSLLSLE